MKKRKPVSRLGTGSIQGLRWDEEIQRVHGDAALKKMDGLDKGVGDERRRLRLHFLEAGPVKC